MIGTGWLGWTEQQTLETRMPVITLAWQGRQEMLLQMGGVMAAGSLGGAAPAPEVPSEPLPAQEVFERFRLAAGKPAA